MSDVYVREIRLQRSAYTRHAPDALDMVVYKRSYDEDDEAGLYHVVLVASLEQTH